jgi:peroxiredoxin family protein
MNDHEAKKASIVVFSGDMDKVMAAFIIATTAAASGMKPQCSSPSGASRR